MNYSAYLGTLLREMVKEGRDNMDMEAKISFMVCSVECLELIVCRSHYLLSVKGHTNA